MSSRKSISLSSQIKKVIGNRVLICSLVLTVILFALTIYDLFVSIDLLQSRINQQIKPLENFVISQVMIDNMQAIELKLHSVNEQNLGFTVEWVPHTMSEHKEVTWQPPFNWVYDYQLGEIAGYQFGYFKLTGSFLADKELVNDVIIRFLSLFIFIVTVLGVLYPLAKKIPQKIFINPINHFISLMSESENKQVTIQNRLPIELQELETKIIVLLENAKEHERNKSLIKIGEITRQVAHDIRSPLAALEMAADDTAELPEEQRLMIRGAVARIRDIANNLLNKNKVEQQDTVIMQPILLNSAINSLISEKRLQLRDRADINIDFLPSGESYGLFSKINCGEFKRVISNLINNAAEAISHHGEIIIKLEILNGSALILIQDNGCGMSPEFLNKLGQRDFTSKKQEGSGLGVVHAMEMIRSWDGQIKFESKLNVGTTIYIQLPLCPSPPWFLDKLFIQRNSNLMILDDDPSIHQVWNFRFDRIELNQHLISRHDFQSSNQLEEYLRNHHLTDNDLMLCDYEIIGERENGLDIIQRLNLEKISILATSRYEQPEIQARCEQLGVKLLPKSLAALVPIIVI